VSPAFTAGVLLVEDDAPLRRVMSGVLERAHFRVDIAADGLTATEKLRRDDYEIVLLDIGLPVIDGWEILRTLDTRREATVIVVSAGDEGDKIRALDLGAEDYLIKPFRADQLLARVAAVLHRIRGRLEAARILRCASVTVDLSVRTVTRSGRVVHLSPTECLLLSELARNAGLVVDHRTLLARVWGPMYAGDRYYLHTFIQRLRRKLEDDPEEPRIILTVGRLGYRLNSCGPDC
jgi:two-component system, OmpR family, KDP operon response regulator KdpE